jgi:glycosyltransferase involved in cell wall biosynthesis
MKVLHIETGMHLYGGALQVVYLLRGLHAAGVTSLLACPAGSAVGDAARPVAEVHPMAMRGDLDPRFGWQMARLMRRIRPDLVHVHSRRGADLWGPLAARLTGARAIITRRVDNPEPGWLARFKYGVFERVVTISEGIRQVLLAEGVPADKVVCVHSAVDVGAYRQGCDRAWFRREFALAEDETVVAVIAQLIPRKGHQVLIDALPEVLAAAPRTRVLFFGQGPLREALEAHCVARGVTQHVVFAGFRADLERILPCLDLVVHPAFMEGLGVSLLQAAACGVAIVAARAGGIPEVVRDGESGLLVEPGEPRPLAAAVLALLREPERRQALGRGGRALVERSFSLDSMVAGNLAVYRMLLGEERGRCRAASA